MAIVTHSLTELAARSQRFGGEPWWATPGARGRELTLDEYLVGRVAQADADPEPLPGRLEMTGIEPSDATA